MPTTFLSNILKSENCSRLFIRKKVEYSQNIYYVEIHPKEVGLISILPESSPYLVGPSAYTGMYHGIFDFMTRPFKNHFMYLTVEKMFEGKNVRETEYFRKLLKYNNEVDAAIHVEKLNRIKNRLQEQGFLSQYEIGNMNKCNIIGEHKVPVHEMIIGMDRWGRLFRIAGGRHRLAIAQHLGLDKMSAVLTLYHKDAKLKMPAKCRVIRTYPYDYRPFNELSL